MKVLRWFNCLLLIILLVSPGYALVVKSGDEIEIAQDEVVDDDLIAFGKTVTIKGRVDGNVCAFAQDVTISGEVDGTIFAGAANVNITSSYTRTIWACGGEINVSGDVHKNVIMAGGKLCVCENARIGKDVTAFGANFSMEGEVDDAIKGSVGDFIISGTAGQVNIKADKANIKSSAIISGDLIIEGDNEPVIQEGATIAGEIKVKVTSEEKDEDFRFAFAPIVAFFITLYKIIIFISKLIVGLVLIAISKVFMRKIMDTMINKPWLSLGWGFLGLVIIPVSVFILFLVIIGFPVAIFGVYVFTIVVYLASIFVSLVVGEKIIQLFKKKGEISLYLSFIIGFILISLLVIIPILGFIVKLFVVLFGTGMFLVGCWNLFKEMKEKEVI